MNKKIILLILVFLSVSAHSKNVPIGQDSYDGTYPGARSMAMGGAGAGLSNNNESFYYNAASAADDKQIYYEISFIPISEDTAQIRTGLNSLFISIDSASLSWRRLSKYSLSNSADNKVSVSINSLSMSIAADKIKNVSMGYNLSYIYGTLSQASYNSAAGAQTSISDGNGFAFDFSFLFPARKHFNLGLNLKNIAGFMFYNGYEYQQLPFSLLFGLGYENGGFSAALDWDKKFYKYSSLKRDFLRLGIEQSFNDIFFLRAGAYTNFDFDNAGVNYSGGISFRIKKLYEISISSERRNSNNQSYSYYLISISAF